MSFELPKSSFILFFQIIKEYWFLITLGLSVLGTFFYMLVFRVNPWDTYRDISYRKEQVNFHNKVGQKLLEQGHYKMAKVEFEKALNLKATNYEALNGRYLTELFLAMDSPDWDPGVGLAVKNELHRLGIIKQKQIFHIVEKYLGDLHHKIHNFDAAREYYESALSVKHDYPDALVAFAWFIYFDGANEEIKRIGLPPKLWTHLKSATMRKEVCHATTKTLHQTV